MLKTFVVHLFKGRSKLGSGKVSVVEQQEEALLLLATAGSDVDSVDAEGVKASDLLPDRLRAQLLEG